MIRAACVAMVGQWCYRSSMRSRQQVCQGSGAVLALALFPIACGGGSTGPISVDDYCDEYADMICRAAERCDCLQGFTVEICHAYVRPGCVDEVEDPVNEGRYTYDASAAGQCLAELERAARDCSTEGDEWPESCDRMLQGALDAGDPCDDDDECRGALECHDDRCTALPRDGEACFADETCAEDHYCGSDDSCHAYPQRGESCADSHGDCAGSDLHCTESTQTCQPYPRQGESCADSYGDCADDLYCTESTETCQPYPRQGESCADSYGDCDDGLYCDASSICRAQGGANAACSDDEQCLSWDCSGGLCAPEDPDDICDFM